VFDQEDPSVSPGGSQGCLVVCSLCVDAAADNEASLVAFHRQWQLSDTSSLSRHQKSRQHLTIVISGQCAVVIHLAVAHDQLQVMQPVLHGRAVFPRNDGWVDQHRTGTFQIDKTHRPVKLKFQFVTVDQVQQCHIMTSKPQVLQTAAQRVRRHQPGRR
jgi:hypothetical protein